MATANSIQVKIHDINTPTNTPVINLSFGYIKMTISAVSAIFKARQSKPLFIEHYIYRGNSMCFK